MCKSIPFCLPIIKSSDIIEIMGATELILGKSEIGQRSLFQLEEGDCPKEDHEYKSMCCLCSNISNISRTDIVYTIFTLKTLLSHSNHY